MFRTAVFIDGRFFLNRLSKIDEKYSNLSEEISLEVASIIFEYGRLHAQEPNNKNSKGKGYLYRIFFYDCPPLDKNAQNPIDGKTFSYKKTAIYQFTTSLHKHLKTKRKMALRLGRLDTGNWVLNDKVFKKLIKNEIAIKDLKTEDLVHVIRQKEIDVKIGVDISSVAFKKQVERIVLITGDSDFVPAAKLARREGMDFVLDNMGMQVNDDLFEHIDGICTHNLSKVCASIQRNNSEAAE